jgi:DNA-binding CsgD family transcriptional regulator
MKNFREKKETNLDSVKKYNLNTSFTEISEDIKEKIEKFNILREKSKTWNENGERSITAEEIEEVQKLKEELSNYFREKIKKCHKSILSDSINETNKPWKTGCDSEVYLSSNEKYVQKYSVPVFEANSEAILYLRNKYHLLRKFLGDLIPQSVFFYGERLQKFKNKNPDKALKTEERIITIQRKAQGKTFQEMDKKEKTNPETIKSLKEAHYKYITAKKILAETCKLLNFPENLLDLKLDIGFLSKKEDERIFDINKIAEFSSPNIIYNQEKNQIYFFDFSLGYWNEDKQKVFDFIMNRI